MRTIYLLFFASFWRINAVIYPEQKGLSIFKCNFNPLVPNEPFLYPLKTSENLTVFWYFHGVEKSSLETNGLICKLRNEKGWSYWWTSDQRENKYLRRLFFFNLFKKCRKKGKEWTLLTKNNGQIDSPKSSGITKRRKFT